MKSRLPRLLSLTAHEFSSFKAAGMTDENVSFREGESRTSTTLLRSALAQDTEAWEALVDAYGPLVYRYCRRQGLQPACANDVVQEVFAAVARKLGHFHHDQPGDSFRAWLLTIAVNKLRDRGRKNARIPKAEGGTDAQLAWLGLAEVLSGTSSGAENGSDARMRQAMAVAQVEFADDKWGMFCALVIDNSTPQEVAHLYGVTTNVVYLTKSRILRRLREILAPQ